MQLPFFYKENIEPDNGIVVLDEDNSRHAISVLRLEAGEALHLTDGKGSLVTASIEEAHKKKCRLQVTGTTRMPAPSRRTAIGISLVKNPVRLEWFLEKATEIGIAEVFPLHCARTEKQHFRLHRMQHVLVSALLQSRQTWLPVLHEPVKFEQLIDDTRYDQQFIAHCIDDHKKLLAGNTINTALSQLILIGPEGDFTPAEIAHALEKGFIPVSLGNTRLRTETAGMVAAVLLRNAL
jgi:16S rRNA (uracil1498-N3)-methyltransferase